MGAYSKDMGEIYFLQTQNADGYIKIGWTTSIKRRLMDGRVMNPYELVVLATIGARFWQEGGLQNKLARSRLRGEWFYPSPEVLDCIAQVHAGVPIHTILGMEKHPEDELWERPRSEEEKAMINVRAKMHKK